MPDSCCAVGCSNRRKKNGIPFYGFPKNSKKRQLWVNAVGRKDWSESSIEKARLCGEHFISGKHSRDQLNTDYVPSIFNHSKMSETTQKSKQKRFDRLMKRRQRQSLIVQKNESTNRDEPSNGVEIMAPDDIVDVEPELTETGKL